MTSSPTWNLSGYFGPLVVETGVQRQQQLLLFIRPRPVTQARIQVVQVALSALLAHSPGHVVGYLRGGNENQHKRKTNTTINYHITAYSALLFFKVVQHHLWGGGAGAGTKHANRYDIHETTT